MAPSSQIHSVGKASPGKLALLYDGSCEMCITGVRRACNFDNSGQLEPLDLFDQAARTRFPNLDLKDLVEELHAVDDAGNIFRGARAVNEILRRQNGIRSWLAYLWYIPGYAWLADRQYKRIAASRYQRDASGRFVQKT
jgi:predicted DCC family thiol-disulfide oxidoreductase YuxK